MLAGRAKLLEEMVRLAERTLDHQLASTSLVQQRNEQSILLGLALLGVGPATAAALVVGSPADAQGEWRLLPLALAALLNLGALVGLAWVGLAASADLVTGPSLRWLAERALDDACRAEHLHLSLLAAAPAYAEENGQRIARLVRQRRIGVILLACATAGYAVPIVFILAGAVIP